MKKSLIIAAVLALFAGSFNSASATEYRKVITYKTVIACESKQVPYTVEVVKYDHCGKAYTVCETRYKTIEVEVKKVVPVVKYVPVCDY